MFKFLFKLALVVAAAYLLLQIPFFAKIRDNIKASVMEKVQNVTTEADRIKGKVDEAGKVIDDTKQKVTGIADQIKATGKNVEDTFTTINKTADALKNAIKTDPVTPEATPPPAQPTIPPTPPTPATK